MQRYLDIEVITRLHLQEVPQGVLKKYWLHLISNGMAQPVYLPLMVIRGHEPGPIVGVTAGVHGNELNGVPVVQQLFADIDPTQLRGTLIGVPAVNVLSLLSNERRFLDGEDLNRIMPGKKNGNRSQIYAYRFVNRIIKELEYLIDLHTASNGRVNSHYIRADMRRRTTSKMATLQNAQIILNNAGTDGTLRSAAADLGVHAITVEVGDPNKFQERMIQSGLTGIFNILYHLEMLDGQVIAPVTPAVRCRQSYWIYADRGGILEVFPPLATRVNKGDRIALIRDVFGEVIKEYRAPEAGIVIGKSVHPVNQTGGRILHLGVV
ncbi:MAG: succinylglutamate desuccinylase/aspartoacylase family protein [Bernardetiaceae bacterium]